MDLVSLRYLVTIASCGSLSAAAKQLKVSQPALTQAIRQLERELGSTLLVRERSGVTLTVTGEELQRCAAEVLETLSRAQRRIQSLEQDAVGSFTVGCHESLGAYFLPEFMASFLEAAPGIELSLWNGTSAAVQQAVLARRVHFGLVVNPHPHPDLVVVDLFHDAVDILVRAPALDPSDGQKSADGARTPMSWAEATERLRRGPLIYAERVGQCAELVNRLAAQHLLPTRTIHCGDLELVKSLLLAGVGVALLPRRVAGYSQKDLLRRLHPELPYFPDTISLIYRADMHRTRAALRLKDALIAHGHLLEQRGDGLS